jgi:hypothetical protein
LKRRNFFQTLVGCFGAIGALWAEPAASPVYPNDANVLGVITRDGWIPLPPDPVRWPGIERSRFPGPLAHPLSETMNYRAQWPTTKRGPSGGWTPKTGWFGDPGE